MIINKLSLGNNYSKLPNKSLVGARNVVFDNNFDNLTNEDGFLKVADFAAEICGIIATDKDLVVFCTDNNGDDYIYQLLDDVAILFLRGNLQLDTNYPITGEFNYNNKGELVVVFNDTHNPLRTINFTSLQTLINQSTKYFIDSVEGLNTIKLIPDFNTPIFNNTILTTGKLPKGTYQITLSYYIGDFDRLAWSVPSQPIYISKVRNDIMKYHCYNGDLTTEVNFTDKFQLLSELNTDKSIQVSISNIDTNFNKYKLALVHRTDTSIKVYDLGDYNTTNVTNIVTTLPEIELSLDEVTIPYINYNTCEDITISDNRLTIVGPKSDTILDYQKYANNITVKYTTTTNVTSGLIVNIPDTIKTGIYDEIYALYIGLIGKDSTMKGFFHIPGRAAKRIIDPLNPLIYRHETDLVIQDEINNNYINSYAGVTNLSKYFQLFNTAAPYSASDKYLAYWENENEVYPNKSDFQVWDVNSSGIGTYHGTIVGEKVRHHKMPDFSKLYDNTIIDNVPNKSIGLVLSDIKFPITILNEIQGYVIAIASRDTNNATSLGIFPLLRDNFYAGYDASKGTDGVNLTPPLIPPYNFNNAGIRFNDFSLLENKPSLSNLYLKSLYKTNKSWITGTNSSNYISDNTIVKSLYNKIIKVDDYKYIPRDNIATSPPNKGREESLILQSHTEYNDNINNVVCMLKSALIDVFSPFYQQRLSIISDMFTTTIDQYSYTTGNITNLDGFLSIYYTTLYRGDQTITYDTSNDTPTISRNNDPGDGNNTYIFNTFKVLNISTVNTNMKELQLFNNDIDYNSQAGMTAAGKAFKWMADNPQTIIPGVGLVMLAFGWGKHSETIYNYESNFSVDPSIPVNISYNNEYSFINNLVPYYSYNYNNVFVVDHPYTIARSAIQAKESNILGWRYFSALEYYVMPKHRGFIKSVTGLDNILLIHCEHSLFVAKFKDKISITDGNAYIGTADIFDRKPDELIPTGVGKAGIQSRFGNIVSEFGYTFVDTYDNNIYNYANNSFDSISDIRVKSIFTKYMTNSDGNPLTGNDLIFGVDVKNRRIIVTNIGATPFTMSFCYDKENIGWICFHDYIPCLMVATRKGSYSVNNVHKTELYKFNAGAKGTYYNGSKYSSYIDVLINDNPNTDKTLNSVALQSGVDDDANNIDQVFFYNKNQCSKIYDLVEFNDVYDNIDFNSDSVYGTIRYFEGFWNYNLIRDYTTDDITQNILNDFGIINGSVIHLEKEWYQLSDISGRFFIVRLISLNSKEVVFRDIEYDLTLNHR